MRPGTSVVSKCLKGKRVIRYQIKTNATDVKAYLRELRYLPQSPASS